MILYLEGEEGIERFAELLNALGADEAKVSLLSILEGQNSGDGHDAILHRQVILFVDIVLANFDTAGIFFGHGVDCGAHADAGTAPGGPKIDHHGLAGGNDVMDILVSKSLCHNLLMVS